MQQKTYIPLSALSRNLPDPDTPDGGMADMLGFRYKDGALRLIPPDREETTINLPDKIEPKAVYIHNNGTLRNIFLYTAREDRESLCWATLPATDGFAQLYTRQEEQASEPPSFTANGNIVEFTFAEGTSLFFYWDSEKQNYQPYEPLPEGAVTVEISRDEGEEYLDNCLMGMCRDRNIYPYCFKEEVNDAFANDFIFRVKRDEIPAGFRLPDNLFDANYAFLTNVDYGSCAMPRELVAETMNVRQAWIAKNKAQRDDSAQLLTGTRMALCAIRGLNGQVRAVSQLVAFDAGADNPVFMVGATTSKTSDTDLKEAVDDSELGGTGGQKITFFSETTGDYYVQSCMAPAFASKFVARVNFPHIEDFRDQITSVDIYLSKEINTAADADVDNTNARYYKDFRQPRTVKATNRVNLTPSCVMMPPLMDEKELYEEFSGKMLFYLSASFTPREIAEGVEKELRDVSEADEPVDLSFTPGSAWSRHTLSFVYNGRYHFAGIAGEAEDETGQARQEAEPTPTANRKWSGEPNPHIAIYTPDQEEYEDLGDIGALTEPKFELAAKVAAPVPVTCTKLKDLRSLFHTGWGMHEFLGTNQNNRSLCLKTIAITSSGARYLGEQAYGIGQAPSPLCSFRGEALSFTLYCRVEMESGTCFFRREVEAHNDGISPWAYALNRLTQECLRRFADSLSQPFRSLETKFYTGFATLDFCTVTTTGTAEYEEGDSMPSLFQFLTQVPPFKHVEHSLNRFETLAPFLPILTVPMRNDVAADVFQPCLGVSATGDEPDGEPWIAPIECYDTRWTRVTEEEYKAAGTTRNPTGYEPNTLLVSEEYDPYSVSSANTYTIGRGRILALSTGTGDVSAGTKYGTYPLYVFCTDGIYLLELSGNSEGPVYASVTLVSTQACIDPSSVTACAAGVAFRTATGIMYISGQVVSELSATIEGSAFLSQEQRTQLEECIAGSGMDKALNGNDTNPIQYLDKNEFLQAIASEGTTYAYNSVDNELIVKHRKLPYAYIYQFATQSWIKRLMPGNGMATDYPDVYRYELNQEDTTYTLTLYDLTTPAEGETTHTAYFVTRPIKAGDTGFKRVAKLTLRGRIRQNEDGATLLLFFASNDARSWRFIGGNRRAGSQDSDQISIPSGARPWKYYRVAFIGRISESELTRLTFTLSTGEEKLRIS